MTSIALYDPRRLSEGDFLKGFIARQELVDFLLEQLRRIPAAGEARHRHIVGSRGMGKTSLLRRLAIGIGRDAELATTLLPLTFREEQYNVRSLDRFWRNCGESLAEWLEQSGDADGAARLDRDMRLPVWQEADGAAEAFRARVAETGRRPVLLVDNLDLVLDALPEEQHWQLRRALQAADGPVLYGAATQPLRQSGDAQAAFYEFFRVDVLEPLSPEELLRCLRRLAAARGAAGTPVLAVLDREPERLRVLHTLTGGNPRILTLIYQLLERAESETVFADLEALLDQLTPLYKARVEELRSDLQRCLLDAIALHWDPITSHDLSAASNVEITTVSSQLSRLKNLGLVEEVPTSGARAGYQLVERFFNIWYLMRHGTRRTRQKMRWLTAFLQTFYQGDDLKRLRERFAQDGGAGAWRSLYAEALDAAIEATEARAAMASSLRSEDEERRGSVKRLFVAAWEHGDAGRYAEAEAAYREAIAIDPKLAPVWNNLGALLADHLQRPEDAERAYRQAIGIGGGEADFARANLLWLYLDAGRGTEAQALRAELSGIAPVGLHLVDAALDLAQDNFGAATRHLDEALALELNAFPNANYFDDLLRLLRLFERRGYGERLIGWFEETGHADRHRPIHAAFVALVRGERMLLDVNPEVRQPAERIYRWLASRPQPEPPASPPAKRRRGRPPKR